MSDSAIIWARLGRQASVQGQTAFALTALTRALGHGEDSAPTWIALAIARAHEKQTEGAIAALQQAVERAPDAIDAWCMLGELALDVRQYGLALQALQKCYALDPASGTPHGARAKALARKAAKALAQQQK